MCGIAGLVATEAIGEVDRRVVAAMTRALAHRGPDAEGLVDHGPVALGNRRLEIIDPAGGGQPMTTAEGDLAVTFNGAILNHVELRRDLEASGARFASRSDTEVLLHLYRADGDDLVHRLRGMFAFAIHDRRRDRVLLARDGLGVKPLYLARAGARSFFASEPKALLVALPDVEPDREGLLEYLAFGYRHGEGTLFAGITRLRPGHRAVVTPGRPPRIDRWYDPEDETVSADDWEEAVAAALDESVRIALRADVPCGVTLSGGVDSSVVAALVGRHGGSRAPAFTGAFPDHPGFDESAFAAVAAKAAGLTSVLVTPRAEDVERGFTDLVRAMDEPAGGPGVIPQFVVAREAARHVRVVLGGQGGDELFAGYVRQLIDLRLGAIATGDAETLRALEPGLEQLRGYEGLIARAERGGIPADPVDRYHRIVDRREGLADVLAPDLASDLENYPARDVFAEAFPATPDGDPLSRTMRYERTALLPALLHVEDRATMAYGLESRVPLLDPPLVTLALSAPPERRLAGGRLKALLRDAASPWLPRKILDRRDKMGFPVPLAAWAAGPLRGFLRETLLGERARARGLTRPAAVETLIANASTWGRALWALLNLEVWHRVFVDSRPAPSTEWRAS